MTPSADAVWQPQQRHFDNAHVLALARALGLSTYDEMHAFSLANPAEYWRVTNDFLGIVWSEPPTAYVNTSRGIEFPLWFPGGELNWVDTVLAWAEDPRTADAPGIVAESENGGVGRLTFRELATQVRRFAAGLRARGIGRGDRIGLLCENGIEATVSLLATAYLGAIVAPLFSGFGVDAIVSRLAGSSATALIATTGFSRRGRYIDAVPTVLQALAQLPNIEQVFWKPAKGVASPGAGPDWQALAETAEDGIPSARMSPNDPFMVIYTSGTTGKPKGPVHTHGGFPLKIAHDSAVHFNVGPGDVYCWPADMGWVAGSLVLCAALLRGATLVTYDGAPDFPDWSRMSRLVERHRITHFGSAPTLIRGMASNEAIALAGDRSTLELLITAGESIAPEHYTWFRTRFGDGVCPLINYTGGTEVSGALLASVVVKPIKPAGFNTASPGIDVIVADPDGKPLIGAVGEVAIRAPFVGMTSSFWQDDERYLESYWHAVPGMWIHGDLAVQDEDGGFHLMGRSDDTLKVAGKRLGPAEIEEIVLELAGVHEAAAVGVADPAKGEKLVVFIVAKPGWNGDLVLQTDLICRHIEQRMGKPFRPSAVHFVAMLPKTRSSKVMRRAIRKLYAGEKLGDLSALDNPAALDEIGAAITPRPVAETPPSAPR
jgi:acetyl-CoA synthetase